MMRTLYDLAAVLLAMVWFGPFLVPPGYLLAWVVDLNGFRGKRLAERLLWAVALSVPLAILWTVIAGRLFPAPVVPLAVLAADAVLLVLAVRRMSQGRTRREAVDSEDRRWQRVAALAMLLGALYTAVATLGITVGRKLYEGTYAGDWSVRIPLTAAAIQNRVPIPTPFYGVFGLSAPLRYYYYWYALCGAVGRMGHLPARPVLAASSAWSGVALVSVLFLLGKYLFGWSNAAETGGSLRRMCALSLGVSCVLGLDVLPAIAGLLLPHAKLFPEMEWWRSQGDFSPSFHTAVLYMPHHTAGLACCMLGFLLLTLSAHRAGSGVTGWRNVSVLGACAGVCFAAALGTSTYITAVFAFVCTLLVAERALARDWRAVGAIALAGVVALPFSATYAREILSGAGATLQAESTHIHHARFVAFFPRNVGLPRIELLQIGNQMHYRKLTPFWVKALLRPPLTVLLFTIELGFFGFVLLWRGWVDLRLPRRLTEARRMQWVLFAGLALPALLLSSEPVIGVNDLGRHAGLALRLMAVLWATPLVTEALRQPWGWPLPERRWVMRAVYAAAVLGLCGQVWQAVVQRSYFLLVDRGVVTHPFAPFPRVVHYGPRYFEMREAFEAMDRAVPWGGHVQYNPASTDWALMTDYLQRPVAAFDTDCEAAFGGDLALCHREMPAIRAVFGGGRPLVGKPQAFDAAGVTPASFDRVCAENHLSAMVATASDRVWTERASWVWVRPVLFANASVRVVGCPAPL